MIPEICGAGDAIASRDIELSYVGAQDRANGAAMYKVVDVLDNLADIDLLVDGSLPSPYLVFTVASDELGPELVEAVCARLPTLTIAQLLEQAAAETRKPGALLALGMGLNGAPSTEAERLMREGLKSPDLETRYNAAAGASFMRSRELAEALGEAAEVESDEGVARVMRAAQGITGRTS